MNVGRLVFRIHALRRMFERRITEVDVRDVLEHGETIEDRPDDLPYPSRLVLGRVNGPALSLSKGRPLHVVAADNRAARELIVVTVYEPDRRQWRAGFRRRSKR